MNLDLLNDKLSFFKGRLRARQSAFEGKFLIEQRTGRGTLTGIADLKSHNRVQTKQRADAHVQARDGYSQVMEVQHGHAFGCERCGARLRSPINETVEVKCECGHQNYTAFYVDEQTLFAYLKRIDPEEGYELKATVRENDRFKESRDRDEMRQINNQGGGHLFDELISQLPTARLSGATKMWLE